MIEVTAMIPPACLDCQKFRYKVIDKQMVIYAAGNPKPALMEREVYIECRNEKLCDYLKKKTLKEAIYGEKA